MREGLTITIEDNAIAFGYPLPYDHIPIAGEVITWKGLKLELTEVSYGFSHLKITGYILNTLDARNELDMAFAGAQSHD